MKEDALLLAPEENTSATETAHEDDLQIVERARVELTGLRFFDSAVT